MEYIAHYIVALAAFTFGVVVGIFFDDLRSRISGTRYTQNDDLDRKTNANAVNFYRVPIILSIAFFLIVIMMLGLIGFDVWDPTFWRDPNQVGGGAEAIRNFVFTVGALATIPVGLLTLGNAFQRTKALDAATATGELRLQTETYAKSVELLGSKHFAQILGGIYSLERLARETENQEFFEQIQSSLVSFLHAVPASISEVEGNRTRSAIIEVLDRSFVERTKQRILLRSTCNLPDFSSLSCGPAGLSVQNPGLEFESKGNGGILDISFETRGSAKLHGSFPLVMFNILSETRSSLTLGDQYGSRTQIDQIIAHNIDRLSLRGMVTVKNPNFHQLKTLEAVEATIRPECLMTFARCVSGAIVLGGAQQNVILPRNWNDEDRAVFQSLLPTSRAKPD